MPFPQIDIQPFILQHGVRVLSIIIGAYILFQFLAFARRRVIHALIAHQAKDRSREQRMRTIGNVIMRSGMFLILLTAGIMLLEEFGVNAAPILASASVVGVAVGLGAQTIIKDIIGGLIILSENQYSEGDCVKFGDAEGEVCSLTLRKTVVKDAKGALHHISNGQLAIIKVIAPKNK